VAQQFPHGINTPQYEIMPAYVYIIFGPEGGEVVGDRRKLA
jgi:hypothetical protein